MDAATSNSNSPEFQGFPPSGSTLCAECDYDLQGLPSDYRCPECGWSYDERTLVYETERAPLPPSKPSTLNQFFWAIVLISIGYQMIFVFGPKMRWTLLVLFAAFELLRRMIKHFGKRFLLAIGPTGLVLRQSFSRKKIRPYEHIKVIRIKEDLGLRSLELMLHRDKTPDRAWSDFFLLDSKEDGEKYADLFNDRANEYLAAFNEQNNSGSD